MEIRPKNAEAVHAQIVTTLHEAIAKHDDDVEHARPTNAEKAWEFHRKNP